MAPEAEDWEEAYFLQQVEFAEMLGCVSHPNDIAAAIEDLQRRAAGNDRKRARRCARLKAAMIKALKSEGVLTDEVEMILDDLEWIAGRLVSP